ncbi:hypothetical protein LCGC14_2418480 [marine sediment metagenome]|uniref:Uncharacterized protein n=1 Tax=marine sediment metagenome TaxID=412755 RepID=A0A0F9BQH3_9ZZZZ
MPRTKHAISVAKHSRMMRGLGFKGGMRNYETYLRKLTRSRLWNKSHPSAIRAANHRYQAKIEDEMGSQGRLARPLYAMNHAAEHLKRRKDRGNEARKALLRLQTLWPGRRGGRSTSALTL